MNLRKKDNRLEEFKLEKLERSIKNAASDINVQLNASDVKLISNAILRKLENLHSETQETSSYEIIGVTVSVLKELNFRGIITSYLRV